MLEAFPDAKLIAASGTLAAIKGNVKKKLAVWGPQLKENGPQTLANNVVLPDTFDGPSLTVDGETVEIVKAEGFANRRYLWVVAFEEELAKAADGAARKAAMEKRFPNLGMGVALDIGSKVAKGEMSWG